MKRVRANDGSFMAARAGPASHLAAATTSTDKGADSVTRAQRNLESNGPRTSSARPKKTHNRTNEWVRDQEPLASRDQPSKYEPTRVMKEKATERQQRFREQGQFQHDMDRITAVREEVFGPRMAEDISDLYHANDEDGDGDGKGDMHEKLRQLFGHAILYVGSLAAEEMLEDEACDCDGSECMCPTEDEREERLGEVEGHDDGDEGEGEYEEGHVENLRKRKRSQN
ncbi:hypothetical protein PG989_016587 [Apiospora arundinis]